MNKYSLYPYTLDECRLRYYVPARNSKSEVVAATMWIELRDYERLKEYYDVFRANPTERSIAAFYAEAFRLMRDAQLLRLDERGRIVAVNKTK